MLTHNIAIVIYSLYTTSKLSFATENTVIFNIFRIRKYLNIVYGSINSPAPPTCLILILRKNVNFRERDKREKGKRVRQTDILADRRTNKQTGQLSVKQRHEVRGGRKRMISGSGGSCKKRDKKRRERENSVIYK